LFLGRIVDGLTGANFSILAAYIGDVSKPEERGKLFGRLGGVSGAGFIIGPVIGGFAAKLGYSVPLFLAAGVLFATMLWGFFVMPESIKPEDRRKQIKLADLNPLTQVGNVFTISRLRWLFVASLCYFLPFMMLTTELSVLVVDKLHWTPESIGLMMLMVGCIDIVMQGVLAERLIAHWGEVRLAIAGLLLHFVGFILVGAVALIPNPLLLLAGILIFSIASGLLEPSLSALISKATLPDEQGTVQGSSTAIRALTGIVGPLLAGELYIRFGGQVPFWSSAVVLLLGVIAMQLASRYIITPAQDSQAEPVVA
jgi:DHA1 family tetracycline resistance protein-like MFS transporter